MEHFIKLMPNLLSPEICTEVIEFFESCLDDKDLQDSIHKGEDQFENGVLGRADLSLFLNRAEFKAPLLCDKITQALQSGLIAYINEFPQLRSLTLNSQSLIKVQRTLPMGGYHQFHYERQNGDLDRELVWMFYLNDMPAGEGETEFIYQAIKVPPTQGSLLIWPASFSHVHRGLTVYSKPKYIVTGWFHVVPPPEIVAQGYQ